MKKKRIVIVSCIGGGLAVAAVGLILGLTLTKKLSLQPMYEEKAAFFESMQSPGYLMEEPTEIEAFCGENGLTERPETVLTTPGEMLTGLQFRTAAQAKRCLRTIGSMPGRIGAFRKRNLVFWSAAEHLSGLLTEDTAVENGSCYLLSEEGALLVRYGGALAANVRGKPLRYIGYNAFAGAEIESIALPDSVTEVGRQAFFACSRLQTIAFPAAVRSLGKRAFAYCTALERIELPDMAVGERCFENCSLLRSVSIGGETRLEEGAFYGCHALAEITAAGAYEFDAEAGALYTAGRERLVKYLSVNRAKTFEIPASVTAFAYGAFETNVYLEAVTRAQGCILTEIPAEAFHNCIRLTSADVTRDARTIGDRAFFGCKALADAVFSEALTWVGREAFRGCARLTAVLPQGAAWGENAFKDSGMEGIL